MSKRLFQLATLGAVALAGALLWAGFGSPSSGETEVAMIDWAPDLKSPDISPTAVMPDQAFPETLARPLFSPTRKVPVPRPPEPVVNKLPEFAAPQPPPAPVPVLSPDTLVLKGIFITEERRLALIQTPSAPNGLWLKEGAEIEGWKLNRIDKQKVAIEANGQEASLTLYVDKPAN